jgi:hypothetical protein
MESLHAVGGSIAATSYTRNNPRKPLLRSCRMAIEPSASQNERNPRSAMNNSLQSQIVCAGLALTLFAGIHLAAQDARVPLYGLPGDLDQLIREIAVVNPITIASVSILVNEKSRLGHAGR